MDTQNLENTEATTEQLEEIQQPERPVVNYNADGEFELGSKVIYSLHGRCSVDGIENKTMGGENIRFYKLQLEKNSLAKTTKKEPSIWLPVATAKGRGLREMLTFEELEKVYEIIDSREYYFDAATPFQKILSTLEKSVNAEGVLGLAKVVSYAYFRRHREVVPTGPIVKYYESVQKQLAREISEITGESITSLEARFEKGMRNKMHPDT